MPDCAAANVDRAKRSILCGQNHAENGDESGEEDDNSDESGDEDDYNEFQDDGDNEFNYRNVQRQIGIMWTDLTKQNKTCCKNRAHRLNRRVNIFALLYRIPNFWRNVSQILRGMVRRPR